MTQPPVKAEGTGWRDEALSRRHRLWGFDAPFADLDFPVIEYDRALPKALVEFKHDGPGQVAWEQLKGAATINALRELAERARIPFLVVYYRTEPWEFDVYPASSRAVKTVGLAAIDTIKASLSEGAQLPRFGEDGVTLDEEAFVRLLYLIRDERIPPREVLDTIRRFDSEQPGGLCAGCGRGVPEHERGVDGAYWCDACLRKAIDDGEA